MIKSLKDLLDKFSRFTNSLVYDGGICKRLIDLNSNILQIKDSGNGVDENILPKIFEPYFTTKHEAFGVGLGLYIVNELFVKHMNYKIDIQNVTFTFENKTYTGTNFIIDFN
jgi:signal transduction histidine kinase